MEVEGEEEFSGHMMEGEKNGVEGVGWYPPSFWSRHVCSLLFSSVAPLLVTRVFFHAMKVGNGR